MGSQQPADDPNVLIGRRIRALRVQANRPLAHVADALNVSLQAVQKWETGETELSSARVIALAEYFETSTDAILIGSKAKPADALLADEVLSDKLGVRLLRAFARIDSKVHRESLAVTAESFANNRGDAR